MNDFRFALRQLRKNPGYAAVAVIILALGIGVVASALGLFMEPLDPGRYRMTAKRLVDEPRWGLD